MLCYDALVNPTTIGYLDEEQLLITKGNLLFWNGRQLTMMQEFLSYFYDVETELYYLQSRYYNPEWGRFINADAYVSTDVGLLGTNYTQKSLEGIFQ